MTISELVYSDLISTDKKLTSSSSPPEFRRWKRKIEFVLSDAHLKYVLSDPKPTDASLNQWVSDDERARSMILFAMDDLLFDVYSAHETAKLLMDSLAEIFPPGSSEYAVNLYKKYTNYKMGYHTSINDHLLQMRAMAIDLEHLCLSCVGEEAQKDAILNSLPESWAEVRDELRLRVHELNLEDLMRNLRKAEEMEKSRNLRKAEEMENSGYWVAY
eukprot:TRINITY_DN5919_c0_g1_i1.p1 TRINITY_DN5919_c0_g1~~TRINITY_DN5919_c0_g1_i1.p1  ORF type:complete len:250 (+),score=27.56 TRINITY_DN5919_c0_g1_i1:105-752(+)